MGCIRAVIIFILLSANSSALDFSLQTSGAHHVVVSNFMFFQVTATITPGSVDESVVPTVTGLPAGADATFPNLIKYCCDKSRYSIDGPNPVKIATTVNTPPGTYPLTITYTSKSGVTHSVVHDLIVDPIPVAPVPAYFPPDVPLTGQAMWEANMKTFGDLHCNNPSELTPYEGNDYYYDGIWVMYQIADYTKDSKWVTCALTINTFYSQYVLSNPSSIQGWRVFPIGLGLAYSRNGVVASKDAVLAFLNNGYANFQNLAEVLDWTLSREITYGLLTHLTAQSLGVPVHPNFQNVVEVLFGHIDQWFLSRNTRYVQPFMVALAIQALIRYYESTHDPRVVPMAKLAADRLWIDSWDPASQSFLYYNNGGTSASPYDPKCSLGPVTTPCKGPSPDLNLLIAPIYGFVYQQTGQKIYRDRGDMIFNSGVSGAYLQGGKQFSQNFRWSGKYVEWRRAIMQTFQFRSCSNLSSLLSLCQK